MSKPQPSYVDRIARVRVELDHFEPLIWRLVEVPLTMNLKGLHQVIQAVMLFEDYHLFQFDVTIDGDKRRYGIPDPHGGDWIQILSAHNTKLGTLVDRGVTQLRYVYDFGDNWEHTITVEAIAAAVPRSNIPGFLLASVALRPKTLAGSPVLRSFSIV